MRLLSARARRAMVSASPPATAPFATAPFATAVARAPSLAAAPLAPAPVPSCDERQAVARATDAPRSTARRAAGYTRRGACTTGLVGRGGKASRMGRGGRGARVVARSRRLLRLTLHAPLCPR